jgi:hypothetical protein
MKWYWMAAVLSTWTLASSDVFACTCVGHVSPCGAYSNATAVFVGSVSRVDPERTPDEALYSEQTAYVLVERSFKGVEEGDLIVLDQPAHNCAPKYEQGERLLFYADFDNNSQTWEVRGCGRGGTIETSGDDLLFLNGLPKSALKTRLSGRLSHYEDVPQSGFTRIDNLVGLKVRINGSEGEIVVYTDENGAFEIYDLPPGEYSIEPESPSGLDVRFPMPFGPLAISGEGPTKLELVAEGCAGSDFIFSSVARLSGKVTGPRGEALSMTCVDLLPVEIEVDRYFRNFDCTDSEGGYELTRIPPGAYLIAVNKRGEIKGNSPFPTAYYPGVFERERAAVVIVDEGADLSGIDVRIPSTLPTSIVEGVLLYADGTPVSGGTVLLQAEGDESRYDSIARSSTDNRGRFSMRALSGTSGWLQGFVRLSTNWENAYCPDVTAVFRAGEGMSAEVKSNSMWTVLSRDILYIELRLPVASCAKPKKDEH